MTMFNDFNRLSDFYYDNDGDGEDDNSFIGTEVPFEDYQFSFNGHDYSVDGVTTLEGSFVSVYLTLIAIDCNDRWEMTQSSDLNRDLTKFLEESNEFREYIEELASI